MIYMYNKRVLNYLTLFNLFYRHFNFELQFQFIKKKCSISPSINALHLLPYPLGNLLNVIYKYPVTKAPPG